MVTKTYNMTEADLNRIMTSVLEESSKGLPELVRADHERITLLEKAQDDMIKLLTGNGTPSNGLIYKFSLIEQDVRRMAAGIWVIVVAMVGIVVTALWEVINH